MWMVAPDERRMSRNRSYSSMAAPRFGGAMKFSAFHCAAIVRSSTNASRTCFTATLTSRPTSDSDLFPSDEDRFSVENRDGGSQNEQVGAASTAPIANRIGTVSTMPPIELRHLQHADRNDEDEGAELLRAARIVHSRGCADGELQPEQRGQRTDQEAQARASAASAARSRRAGSANTATSTT